VDPLSEVLSLLKLRSYVSGGFDANGDWAVQFGAHDGIKFHAVLRGECWVLVEGLPDPVKVSEGECFLLAGGKPFRLASNLAVEPVAPILIVLSLALAPIVMLPVVLVFVLFQRYFIEGVTLTGMGGR